MDFENTELIEDGTREYWKQLSERPFEEYLEDAQNNYKKSMDFKTRSDYFDAYLKYSVKDKMIFYEAYFGRGMICNTFALFQYLLNDERFAGYTHVWSLEDGDYRSTIINQYKDYPNVLFVYPFTQDYFMYLSQAKYLINNVTFQNYFVKKPEQIVLNTWHGIPMKCLGYDIPDGAIAAANVIRNCLFTDYLLSPVPYMTDIFKYGFKLDGIFPGKIIETGYPRIDNTINADREKAAEELKRLGVSYDPNKKLILYAPTYRGEQYSRPNVSIDEYNAFIETMSRYVDLDEYQILFKPHQIVYKTLVSRGQIQDNFIPAVVDTNTLLGIVDILISDYSSIFFDFLVTKRPVLFYIPDLESYREERGLYFGTESLPGPVSDDLDQVCSWVKNIDRYKEFFDYSKYEEVAAKYTCNDDGNVCERVVNAVFFGDDTHCISLKNDKKKLLFHLDIVKKNGLTSAICNLLNQLDYDKYDVTFYAIGRQVDLKVFLKAIDPNVRVLVRIGGRVRNIEGEAKIEYGVDHAVTVMDETGMFPRECYDAEFHRMFGDAQFDYILYFSGYAAFYANLYSLRTDTKKFIWMHNVIMREFNRPEKGEYRFARNLLSIFQIYKLYDACVSCSYTTMEINKKEMAELGVEGNYLHVRNLFNKDHVVKGCQEYALATLDDDKKYFVDIDPETNKYVFVPMPKEGMTSFITIGRMSAIKNHMALIRAFSRLCDEYDNLMLYILGDGELAAETSHLVHRLGLEGKVVLTGNLDNPFAIMSHCDCFILPSLYEGQPMVLLEARTLNLPIIVSDFSSVKDSCFENGQLLIGTEEDDIYNGMKAFMRGEVPNEFKLDIDEYNRAGLEEFEACLSFADGLHEE